MRMVGYRKTRGGIRTSPVPKLLRTRVMQWHKSLRETVVTRDASHKDSIK